MAFGEARTDYEVSQCLGWLGNGAPGTAPTPRRLGSWPAKAALVITHSRVSFADARVSVTAFRYVVGSTLFNAGESLDSHAGAGRRL